MARAMLSASRITQWCLRCCFWLLLLVALLLLAARLLAPQAGKLQPQLVDYLQQQLQTRVSMSGLQAGWRGASPHFLIDDLSIGVDDAQLYLGKVRVYLRPWELLLPGRNALQMEVINARLALHLSADGWSLSGLSAAPGDSQISASARRQTLQQLLDRGDLRLLDAQVSISTAAMAGDSIKLLVEYADLSRFSGTAWRPQLQQMAQRPAALSASQSPQLTALSEDRGSFGMQLRLRPPALPDTATNAAASPIADTISLAMQLHFTSAGMALEGFVDLPQQPLSSWRELWQGSAADMNAAVQPLQLGSRLWFGWREQDYLQLRGQLDVAADVPASTAGVAADRAGSSLGSEVELLWQASAQDQPARWQLLLDQIGYIDAVSDTASIMAANHAAGGWSAHAEQLRPAHIAVLAAALDAVQPTPTLAQLRQLLRDWVSLESSTTRIDLTQLQVDHEQRIVAVDLSIQDLLLNQSVSTPGQKGADSAAQIADCGPFDVQLEMREQLGWFQLAATAAVCSLPGLVRTPLLLDQISVDGQIEQLEDGFRIAAVRGQIKTPDFSAQTQLQWQQDHRGGHGELHAFMPALLATRLQDYLPPDPGKPGTVRWLEHAMQGGWLRDLRLAWPIAWPIGGATAAKRSWDDLQLTLALDDLLLDYARNWPPAQSMQSSLRIADNQLQASIPNARILDTKLSQATVHIDELFSNARLYLHTKVDGDGEQLLDLLADMPITGKGFSDRDYRLRGPVRAQTDIGIDLADKTTLIYARGTAGLRGIKAVTQQITIDDIRGELGFDDRGPVDSTLRGRWGEHSARLDWKRTEEGPEIRMQGRFPSQQVAHAAADLPALIPKYVDGSSLWKLRLLIDRDTTMVLAYSDLLGTEIRLPAPLDKLAVTRRPLRLALPMGSGQRTFRIQHGSDVTEFDHHGASSGLLDIRLLQLADGSVAAADVHFVDVATDWRVPLRIVPAFADAALQPGQLRFSGHTEAVAALGWVGLLLDYQRAAQTVPMQASASQSGQAVYHVNAKLSSDQLLLGQRNLGPVALRITPRLQPLLAAVASTAQGNGDDRSLALILQGDNIAGSADVVSTTSGTLINVAMDRLYVPAAGPTLDSAAVPAAGNATQQLPQQRPVTYTVNLIADDVRYEQLDLGMVRLELVPMLDGLSLQRLEASSDSINLTATGGWQTVQGELQSQLEMRLDSNDIGIVLRGLGYDDLIRNAQTTMLLDVNWPGDISQFKMQKLQGILDVRAGSGVIPQASPGAGRALGLLSLQALPQRLFLDFSDVFADGMEFEQASGRFVFDGGIATAEDVVIDAAAAKIHMTGTTDLVARTYDQRLLIEPSSSLVLPLIGVIAGGPIGAGAGFALQGLFGGSIGKISKLEYQITGPWQNPTLTAYSPEPTVKIKNP